MSSIVGHALTGAGIFAISKKTKKITVSSAIWGLWLIFIAIAPDLDYVIPALNRNLYDDLRITHSITGSLVLPILTIIFLSIAGYRQSQLLGKSTQVCIAGLSHIILDLLVGVIANPLLWPFTKQTFKLPFGLLPSAPGYYLTNYYMYRNLLIEIGIFVPLYTSIYLIRRTSFAKYQQAGMIALLWCCSAGFMYWAYGLAR
ncbi:MAG: metal-dependent hydrolase [Chloroflexi bacterium]|nr:metal-dependent hydrolase [Chloroflexota bacterium]